jgi:hypothetical protein
MSTDVYSYFYHVCVLKKVMDTHDKQQWIILLGDYHDKVHPVNKEHRAYLEFLLKKCVAIKGKLIVEDLSSINNDGRMICSNFGINCSEGVLGQLASKARELGVVVDNVEFRYCRVAAIGPLLKNVHVDPFTLPSSATITLVSLHKEVVDEIEKIKKYDDGKLLNSFYKKTIGRVRSDLAKMRLSESSEATIAHYCTHLRFKKYRQELEKLCIFDSALIDVNILHSIALCPAISCMFVVAGGSHTIQVADLLQSIGYEMVFITSGSESEPVAISALDTFIK